MDKLHVNREALSSNHRNKEISENIYENQDEIQTLEPNKPGAAVSGAEVVKKSSCKAAAVFLGLLCLLVLTGLISLAVLFTQRNSQWEMEMVLLNNSYNHLTRERNDLQSSYNHLTRERNDLQSSYNHLTRERNDLQSSYNHLVKDQDLLQKGLEDMTKKTDDLQRKLQGCEQFRVELSGSSYYISSSQKSWEESRRDCQQRGADLVIINSKEEQALTRLFQRPIWIGLSDRAKEGRWEWVDGTPLTTSYWAPHEPNDAQGREDCAEIKKSDSENSWNDATCDTEKIYICEKMLAA